MTAANLSARQQKWFASVKASLERDTGKSLAEWVAIARACPETGHRARLKWLKDNHGLLQNRASQVLQEAFPPEISWRDPDALVMVLWADPAARAIYDALDAAAMAHPDTVRTARKGYGAWSRAFQFAAVRPLKGKGVMLGLALSSDTHPALEPRGSDSWSERLKARIALATPADVDDSIRALIEKAWQVS